ncbi:MAG: hypothetical protein GEU78_16120, partial [Actinobacteria bacterium]|nr:hypothetical protein [Actinomycetota bacterium]
MRRAGLGLVVALLVGATVLGLAARAWAHTGSPSPVWLPSAYIDCTTPDPDATLGIEGSENVFRADLSFSSGCTGMRYRTVTNGYDSEGVLKYGPGYAEGSGGSSVTVNNSAPTVFHGYKSLGSPFVNGGVFGDVVLWTVEIQIVHTNGSGTVLGSLGVAKSTAAYDVPAAPVLTLVTSTVTGGVGANDFTWTDTDADEYELQRQKCGTDTCSADFLERFVGDALGYTDQAGAQVVYVYRVRGTNAAGAGAWSELVAVVTGDGLVEDLHGGESE